MAEDVPHCREATRATVDGLGGELFAALLVDEPNVLVRVRHGVGVIKSASECGEVSC